MKLLFLLSLAAPSAFAEEKAAPAPVAVVAPTPIPLPAPAAAQAAPAEKVSAPTPTPAPAPIPALDEVSYELSELRPVSLSAYPTEISSVRRYYLQFRNNDGSHFLVYEEDSVRPPVESMHEMKNSMQAWKASCSVDVRCKGKALCTGKCSNMYYQISNMGAAGGAADKCRLVSFTCFQSGDKKEAAPSPGSK